MQAQADVQYDYTPHDRQEYAHGVLVDELLYGGAGGGGKSRWARAELVRIALLIPGSRQVLFRRTFPDMIRSVEQPFTQEVPTRLASYNRSRHEFVFHNGSIIELAHLQREQDVAKYQGAEYQTIVFEEATHFTWGQYVYLKSRLRAAGKVAERLVELGMRPRMLLTANPGGVGHHWVKKRFVDPAPAETVFRARPSSADPTPGTRCYIPAKATDNPSLNAEYIEVLNGLPENLRRALRDGDWNVLEGVRFAQWSEPHHVIKPEDLPMPALTGKKVIAVDYGYSAPFAAVWMCLLHDGLVVVYREEYATELTARQQAARILELSRAEEESTGEKIPVVMDPSMWRRADAAAKKTLNKDMPPVGSPAHDYMKVLGRVPVKAVNARVHGAGLLDEKLRVQKDGFPRFLVYDTCRDTIRTLPALPRDKKNPEDVETTAEDHLYDAVRYGLMYLAGRTVGVRKPDLHLPSAGPVTAGLGKHQF
ncbi:phage terminase large subunit [Zhihengliuella halotolerans]|uniref:phage terminase large subunit n=1 Tax=Zhihengliuella halotolerans TaxID=370736 RepID=UPI000C804809|nr:phage terminase large subunit [Zhihengliuella halotolerans]